MFKTLLLNTDYMSAVDYTSYGLGDTLEEKGKIYLEKEKKDWVVYDIRTEKIVDNGSGFISKTKKDSWGSNIMFVGNPDFLPEN